MFSGKKRIAAMEALFERQLAEVQERLDRAEAAAQEMAKHAYLIGINRDGRTNKFVFVRAGQMYEIKTMGLLSDNPAQWRKDLLE